MKGYQGPVAREGLFFLLPALLITMLFILLGWWELTILGLLLSLFIAFFFRNPKREIPQEETAIVSPADGRIIHVGECTEDRYLKNRAVKVSIFMNLFNVHINRAPASGKIVQRTYHPGRFFVASRDKSSLLNEQNVLILETEKRGPILLIQIAGFVARRIICYAQVGDVLRKGDIFGMIRFGSRVDLYLPPQVRLNVKVGEHVKGGESIIGYGS